MAQALVNQLLIRPAWGHFVLKLSTMPVDCCAAEVRHNNTKQPCYASPAETGYQPYTRMRLGR